MANAKRAEDWDIDQSEAETVQSVPAGIEQEFSTVGGPVGALHERLASELGTEISVQPAWQYELTGTEAFIRNLSRLTGLSALTLGFVGAAAFLLG